MKPNYALAAAIKSYRRRLAEELFRIARNNQSDTSELCCRSDHALFERPSNDTDDTFDDDGYLTDDEQDEPEPAAEQKHVQQRKRCKLKLKAKQKLKSRVDGDTIPVIAFVGGAGSRKSTLLNLLVGEPVFVTIDEFSEFDALSQVARFKMVHRADRDLILLDVDGLRDDAGSLRLFLAVYAVSSLIVWTDDARDEQHLSLPTLLRRADAVLADTNGDGFELFAPSFVDEQSQGILPEQLRLFLLRKHRRLHRKERLATHKPGFIILRTKSESVCAQSQSQ